MKPTVKDQYKEIVKISKEIMDEVFIILKIDKLVKIINKIFGE